MGHWIWLVGHGIFVFAQRLAFVTILCIVLQVQDKKVREVDSEDGKSQFFNPSSLTTKNIA